MPLDLFLFAKNKNELVEYLKTADLDPGELLPEELLGDLETNNPWRLLGADGEEIRVVDRDGNSGFGVSLRRGDKEAIRILDQLRSTDGPSSRSVGIEIQPDTLGLALRGQNWCGGFGQGSTFGTRRHANRLINQSALKSAGLTGAGVNIVVVDQGLNQQYLEDLGGVFGGGMSAFADGKLKSPGVGDVAYSSLPKRHGSMLLRSIVDLAPNARVFDLPLLPRRIDDVDNFTLNAAFTKFLFGLFHDLDQGPWIFLNAWGIIDRFAEPIRGDYTANLSHPLNWLTRIIGQNSDVVYAAGNSGQFCADPRAPGYDRIPGQAVFGANGLPEVTCVSAVRSDGEWIGASSQGAGPFMFGDERDEKPDLAAPSWFTETNDATMRSTGTSAASAVVAGSIAALRQGWSPKMVSPAEMRTVLRRSARKVSRGDWNERTGAGVIDLAAAIEMLTKRFGPPEFIAKVEESRS